MLVNCDRLLTVPKKFPRESHRVRVACPSWLFIWL
jgi:hypothetical protein